MGKYTYWDCRVSGFRLDYKKRDSSRPKGWRYLYLGYWSRADMLALMTELSPDELLQVLHVEMRRTAKLYLRRKKERENE